MPVKAAVSVVPAFIKRVQQCKDLLVRLGTGMQLLHSLAQLPLSETYLSVATLRSEQFTDANLVRGKTLYNFPEALKHFARV